MNNTIIKWIKNNKKISFFIITLLTLLIFLLYPGNDITCLDRVSPTSTHIETTNARDILETDLPDSEHKLTLIFIPKVSYQIAGSDPPTEITYPYWLGKYEVTQEEWKKVMGWTPVPELNEEDTIAMGALYPMCQISYYECLDFCDRLTEMAQQQGILPKGYCFSLPTVAQWELACSCGKEIVSSGNLEKIAWTNPHGAKARVYPVGLKEPNAWGFHDMWGNVWELCADFYHPHRLYGSNPVNWKTDTGNLSTDMGLSITSVGGGLFYSILDNKEEIPRRKYYADSRKSDTGLRVALVPAQQHQLLKERLKHLHPVPDWWKNIKGSFELMYFYTKVYIRTYWGSLPDL